MPKANSFEERTKLTVYRIGINGIRFLKTQNNFYQEIIRKLYKDKDRSDNFILANHYHTLVLLYLLLSKNYYFSQDVHLADNKPQVL